MTQALLAAHNVAKSTNDDEMSYFNTVVCDRVEVLTADEHGSIGRIETRSRWWCAVHVYLCSMTREVLEQSRDRVKDMISGHSHSRNGGVSR